MSGFVEQQLSLSYPEAEEQFIATTKLKPFLKWAGGKTQLLGAIYKSLPINALASGEITRYVEPFIGSGAVFFSLAQSFPQIQEFYISDINQELILVYITIQSNVGELIQLLTDLQQEYFMLTPVQQKEYFYRVRSSFNEKRQSTDYSMFSNQWIERAAQFIFLNRTCFNGLFRVNSKGEFNVPFGKYNNPTICHAETLQNVSQILQRTTIRLADFSDCLNYTDEHTFIYFDPPYRPISTTSSFTAYSAFNFDDNEQIRLANFCKTLDQRNSKFLLSNSDPKNENPNDHFFETAYAWCHIERVQANRMINCNASKRGLIYELLIKNY